MGELALVGADARDWLQGRGIKPRMWALENFGQFFSRTRNALGLIAQEREILAFSALQWVCIAVAYYAWIQFMRWIPEDVLRENSGDYAYEIAVLLWSGLCIAAAAYPVGILSGCVGAAHFLRAQGQESTVGACLKLVLPLSGRLGVFHAVDGWITAERILDRLPRRGGGSFLGRAAKEAAYYAWKVATVGMLPALLSGRGVLEAGKDSLELLKARPGEVIALRLGYSAVCWMIGLLAYFGGMAWMISQPAADRYSIYAVAGVPLLVAVGIVVLFLRPIFVLAACQLYSDFLHERSRPRQR